MITDLTISQKAELELSDEDARRLIVARSSFMFGEIDGSELFSFCRSLGWSSEVSQEYVDQAGDANDGDPID
jgi:hypothetical protein